MGSLREKPELMSLDNHNKPDKDDSFMGVVHALMMRMDNLPDLAYLAAHP